MVRELLEPTGIQINGHQPWDIQIHNPHFYDWVLKDVNLGLGESYIEQWWDSESLDEMITRVLIARLDRRLHGDWKLAFHML